MVAGSSPVTPAMSITREFTREELDELELPWAFIDSEVIDERRWSIVKEIIFEFEGKFWMVVADIPATELQEGNDPWNYANVVTATQVEKREVTVERWVPVD